MWGRLWAIDVRWEHGDLAGIAAETTRLRWCVEQQRSPLARWHLLVAGPRSRRPVAASTTPTTLGGTALRLMSGTGHTAAFGAWLVPAGGDRAPPRPRPGLVRITGGRRRRAHRAVRAAGPGVRARGERPARRGRPPLPAHRPAAGLGRAALLHAAGAGHGRAGRGAAGPARRRRLVPRRAGPPPRRPRRRRGRRRLLPGARSTCTPAGARPPSTISPTPSTCSGRR